MATKFIKKNKDEETFDSSKIYKSIINAMKSGSGLLRPKIAQVIKEEADEKFGKKDNVHSKEIDKFIISKLNEYGQELTAYAYERYKTTKAYQEAVSIIDNDIFGIVDGTNSAALDENSNKDGQLISTQRDLIAGIESRSYVERHLMPTHLLNAHREGLIHIHDTDYMIHRGCFNCSLINLKDMLQNGTVINGKKIRKPKSFQTACTVATQISLQVANGQYGGQTFSVAHLAPFVRISFDKWKKKISEEYTMIGETISDENLEKVAWVRTREEVKSGVQTIQFQENTFSSSNGQTPFVSIFMWVNEEPEYVKETAMIIEEMINLRYEGMENEYGVKVTPAFPKLLYVLDDNNVPKDSEYRYLTDLAVKCAARRMNPDFISAKVMKEQFDGNVFPCMGCVDKDEVVNYRHDNNTYVESISRMWDRLSRHFEIKLQDVTDCYYMDLYNVEIFDSTNNAYVECKRMNKNADQGDWMVIKMKNNKKLVCTSDHPLSVMDKGRTFIKDILIGEKVECVIDNGTEFSEVVEISDLGCRGEYSYDVTTSSDRFDVSGIASHNCRSFLSPWKDKNGEYKFYGRFNRGVVTINLVDAALSAKGSEERFWEILDERLELCKEALIMRDGILRDSKPTISPIHWMNGSIARLGKNDNFNHLLDGGYSSISLGYIGIHEMVKAMKNCSNTSPIGEEFALRVMDYLEAKTIEWRKYKGLHGCSLYGTPSESLTYKFAQKTAKRFGEIKGITDKDYFTNSYHVNVLEPIDAFAKLKFESQFQKKSKGGAVSYIEVPNMENNLEALSKIVDFMYDTIQYAEINTRNGDSCGECGFMGEMACTDDGVWYCPQCGCKDRNKLNVVRRTCGYIGSTFWNKGKTKEINDRVQHM